MIRQQFEYLMHEPGAVFTVMLSFGVAFMVSKKSPPLVQVLMSGFSALFIVTYWQKGDRVTLGMMWMYAGWAGFLFHKLGLWDMVVALTENLKQSLLSAATGGRRSTNSQQGNCSTSAQSFSSHGANARTAQHEQEEAEYLKREKKRKADTLKRANQKAAQARRREDP